MGEQVELIKTLDQNALKEAAKLVPSINYATDEIRLKAATKIINKYFEELSKQEVK